MNKEEINKRRREHYQKNKKKINAYRRENWGKYKERVQEYRRKNKDKHRKHVQKYRQNNKNREKDRSRSATCDKYGSPPKDMQYHHTTIPYTPDDWILMYIEDHPKIHRID